MAVNCVFQFDNPANTIISLQPNVNYIGTIPNAFEGDYYKFELFENETITFNVAPRPNTSAPINMKLTLYRKDGLSYINLGTSFITQGINQFIYDGVPNVYYFCLTTDFDIDYTISVEFTNNPWMVLGECIISHGSWIQPFDFARKATACDSPVFYTLLDGGLPVGMSLRANGLVVGIPVEQDCYTCDDTTPSFTWYEEGDDGVRKPTTEDYIFIVRAALLDSPATFSDRIFKICVHNNWSVDRDNFIEESDNFLHIEYIEDADVSVGQDIPVDSNGDSINGFVLYDEDGSVGITDIDPVYDDKGVLMTDDTHGPHDVNGLKKINTPQSLPVVEIEQLRELSDKEVAALCKICYIAPEYRGLITINRDKLCVEICEVVEEKSIQPIIQEINAELCEPCPEPTIITGLQLLPTTMCDLCVPEKISIPVVTKYNKKYTYCTEKFINEMITKKICDSGIVCEFIPDVWPDIIKEPDLPTLPSSLCDKICEES